MHAAITFVFQVLECCMWHAGQRQWRLRRHRRSVQRCTLVHVIDCFLIVILCLRVDIGYGVRLIKPSVCFGSCALPCPVHNCFGDCQCVLPLHLHCQVLGRCIWCACQRHWRCCRHYHRRPAQQCLHVCRLGLDHIWFADRVVLCCGIQLTASLS